MTVDLYVIDANVAILYAILVSMTLTLMPGHSGSAKAKKAALPALGN